MRLEIKSDVQCDWIVSRDGEHQQQQQVVVPSQWQLTRLQQMAQRSSREREATTTVGCCILISVVVSGCQNRANAIVSSELESDGKGHPMK